jgi:hypothetical protein
MDDNLDQMYEAVLDCMLTAQHVKEQLLMFESFEKKLQTVQLYKDMIRRSVNLLLSFKIISFANQILV